MAVHSTFQGCQFQRRCSSTVSCIDVKKDRIHAMCHGGVLLHVVKDKLYCLHTSTPGSHMQNSVGVLFVHPEDTPTSLCEQR